MLDQTIVDSYGQRLTEKLEELPASKHFKTVWLGMTLTRCERLRDCTEWDLVIQCSASTILVLSNFTAFGCILYQFQYILSLLRCIECIQLKMYQLPTLRCPTDTLNCLVQCSAPTLTRQIRESGPYRLRQWTLRFHGTSGTMRFWDVGSFRFFSNFQNLLHFGPKISSPWHSFAVLRWPSCSVAVWQSPSLRRFRELASVSLGKVQTQKSRQTLSPMRHSTQRRFRPNIFRVGTVGYANWIKVHGKWEKTESRFEL